MDPSGRVMTMPNSSGSSTRFERDGRDRAALAVGVDQRAEVDVGEHVTGDHEERVVELGRRVADRPGGAERLVLGGVAHADPEVGAVAEVVADLVGEVRDRDHDVVETVAGQQGDDVLEHRPVDERHHRFGLVARQRAQAGALTAGQDHGLHPGTFIPAPSSPPRRAAVPSRSAARASGT